MNEMPGCRNADNKDVNHPPDAARIMGFIRLIFRFLLLVVIIYGLLVVFLVTRLFEWPLGRVWTPRITQVVCALSLKVIGLKLEVTGQPMASPGVVVANHSSWLDIFALNASQQVFFVSKHEVRQWFGIGILAIVTDTVFIERNVRQSLQQRGVFFERLKRGDKLMFFPEGTSTDGQQVLAFKSTLFAALFEDEIYHKLAVQPVAVRYQPPRCQEPSFYAWWDSSDMVSHLIKVLSAPGGGHVKVIFCSPLPVANFASRKELASACEATIRQKFWHARNAQ